MGVMRSFKQEKVDYISERNRSFNQRLGRYYDRFTADIRANLERGTAVWACLLQRNRPCEV